MGELRKLYASLLAKHAADLGLPIDVHVHSSRLKERLLANCPNLTAVSYGRDILLSFNDDVGVALQRASEHADSDAVHLMHTIKLLRNAIFSQSYNFSGSLAERGKAVPQDLLSFVGMLLEGPCNVEPFHNEAVMSVSQLIMFNAIKRRRNSLQDVAQKSVVVRHSIDRETPLPVYMGLMLHSVTRKKKLVERCHKLGLSISYKRVMQIVNKTANAVCSQYRTENLVCPPVLQPGLFTVGAVDNIDHNLSSTTALLPLMALLFR